MRYKFRGKSIQTGKWVYGWYYQLRINEKAIRHYIVENPLPKLRGVSEIEVIPETVGQYVGLNDSKRTKEYPEGQEIYSGDFIKDAQGSIYIVYWDKGECAFKLDYKYYHHRDKDECHTYLPMYSRKGEVIGNIHDNPELKEDTP